MAGAFEGEQMGLPLGGGVAAPPAATVAGPPRRRRPAPGSGVQMALPVTIAQRRRLAGDRQAAAELYAAVLTLRVAGRKVYRCGGLHQVDGRLLTTRELLHLAAAIGVRS